MTTDTTLADIDAQAYDQQAILPDYIIWDEQTDSNSIIRKVAQEMQFPLSEQDKKDIKTLDEKYELELTKQGCAGLAAPQIGISKQCIIFGVLDGPRLKKWRPDLTQTMPKSTWLNPSWEPDGVEMSEAYEACFTVPNTSGLVKRYTKIKYRAYDTSGNLLEGTAEGFLARVIQHEIDHLQGVLFIDYVDRKDLLSFEEYRERRKKAMEVMNGE